MTPQELELVEQLDYLPLEDKHKIARLLRIAEKNEREACAKLVEEYYTQIADEKWHESAFEIAQAIRVRGLKNDA